MKIWVLSPDPIVFGPPRMHQNCIAPISETNPDLYILEDFLLRFHRLGSRDYMVMNDD